jgi:hypothetical protein
MSANLINNYTKNDWLQPEGTKLGSLKKTRELLKTQKFYDVAMLVGPVVPDVVLFTVPSSLGSGT